MLERVFAAAGIERVAVGDKGSAAALFDEIGDDLGIVRAQERQIAELAEVQLDGDEFAVKIDLRKLGLFQQLPKLIELAHAVAAAEIGKINLGCRHEGVLLLLFFHHTAPAGFCQRRHSSNR